MSKIQHQDAKSGGFFYLDRDDQQIAKMSYQWRDAKTIIADHTWVDDSLRGQGVARQLLDALVQFARQQQLRIVPVCSYVELMFRRDPSLADVVA